MFLVIIRILALSGMGLIATSVFYAAWVYRGREGERFSLFTYFISELGDTGVSRGARVFNTALILGSLLLLPAAVSFGLALKSLLGWLGAMAGIVAALSASAVGVFPVNRLEGHVRAALTFFRAGLVMLLCFGAAILLQPPEQLVLPKSVVALNALALLAYLSFFTLLTIHIRRKQADATLGIGPSGPRAPFRWLPTLEWAVFFTTLAWVGAVTWFLPTP